MTAPVPQAAVDIERLCEVMHDAYEAAAVGAGWETQAASRRPWADVPEANKATIRVAVAAVVAAVQGPIKAEALREAANAIEPTTCAVNRTCHEADAITLRIRADRIEAQP